MSERDESVYVRHMLDAIARLGRHVEGVDRAGFESGETIQDAVFRQLEVEAAWIAEVRRRDAELMSGAIEAIPLENALTSMRERFGW